MSSTAYHLHGLNIDSAIPLNGPAVEKNSVDLSITRGQSRPVPATPPVGERLAEMSVGGRLSYAASRTSERYLMRFSEAADFEIATDLARIECTTDPGLDDEFASLFLRGAVLALVLALSGKCVLHASAVEVAGNAFAFVGDRSMGKSTSAALLCTKGAQLIADDVLRVDSPGDGRAYCFPGANSIRLRPGAQHLLEMFSRRPETRPTSDGRIELFPPYTEDMTTLGAFVVPYPRRDISELMLEPVPPALAAFLLTRFSRIPGWLDREVLRQQFRHVTTLAREVPVVTAHIPWGPPFSPATAEQLSSQLNHLTRL